MYIFNLIKGLISRLAVRRYRTTISETCYRPAVSHKLKQVTKSQYTIRESGRETGAETLVKTVADPGTGQRSHGQQCALPKASLYVSVCDSPDDQKFEHASFAPPSMMFL